MKKIYDILLVSPWSEPVNILPSFHIIRRQIEQSADVLAKQKLYDFFARQEGKLQGANVTRYREKFPVSVGLLSMAALLEENGFKVHYMSLDHSKHEYGNDPDWLERIIEEAVSRTKHIIGVTSVTPEFNRAIKILELSKKIEPRLLTVIGGPHVTYLHEESAKNDAIDVIVRGEGEATFLELARSWIFKKDFTHVKGITYKDNGKVIVNKERDFVNLKSIPGPAFHLLPHKDADKFILYTYFERGCINNCAYCVEGNYWGNRPRFRDIQSFVNDLEYLAKHLDFRFIHIIDSDFLLAQPLLYDVCDEIESRKLNIILSINVGPRLFKQASLELIMRMVEVGFKEFLIGSESVDEALLARLKRRQRISDLIRTIELLNKAGVPFISTYWIVGLPGETHKTIQATINAIIGFLEHGHIYHGTAKLFIPYPGTAVYEKSDYYGIKIIANDWERFERYGFPPPYLHNSLTAFELQSYMTLIQAIQLSYFLRRTDKTEEHARNLYQEVDELYLKRIYM